MKILETDSNEVKTCADRATVMRNHKNDADKVKEVVEMMHHWPRLLNTAPV